MFKKKAIYAFLALIICSTMTYTIRYKKPPNTQHAKAKNGIGHTKVSKHISVATSHVTLTCYQPIKKQCDSEPLITSDGSRINLKKLKNGDTKWCAISQDLLYLLPTKKPNYIWIDGYGIYEVRDVMSERFTHSVDILIHPKNSLRLKKENVKIKILK